MKRSSTLYYFKFIPAYQQSLNNCCHKNKLSEENPKVVIGNTTRIGVGLVGELLSARSMLVRTGLIFPMKAELAT